MPMITSSNFKKGMTLMFKGEIHELVDYQHIKPGKGGAFVRTKMRNLKRDKTVDPTLRPDEKIEQVILDEKRMEYLYRDGSHYVFMDNQTYDQTHIAEDLIAHVKGYLKENMTVKFTYAGSEILSVALSPFVELAVADTEPGVKGDTVSGSTKSATLETGAVVQVPLFINKGDVLKVDTRNGKYLERV